MAKKKAISKRKKSKVAAKTAKKAKRTKKAPKKRTAAKRKKVAVKQPTPTSPEVIEPEVNSSVEPVETSVGENLAVTPQVSHEAYLDNQKTSRKRRRTSGQAFTGAVHEEELRIASAEVNHNIDERERIRPPRRSQNQNRSR